MNAPISPISAQALNLVPVASLPVPSSKNDGWILRLRADGQLYESDGTQWSDFLSGGAPPVGSIDKDTEIVGNPSDMNTPQELAGEIELLRTWRNLADPENDGKVNMVDDVYHTMNISAPGQTVFILPKPAKQPLLAVIVFEDLTYRYGMTTFTIAPDNVTLTWHNPIVLQPGYSFTITYR